MSTTAQIIAVVASDIHLSHSPPLVRAVPGVDWYEVQAHYLEQLGELKTKHGVPLIIAGDIFDSWRAPAELINFAIKHLPRCYAIPGQHDLPWHSLKEIKRSPYWTLVQAGVIHHLGEEEDVIFSDDDDGTNINVHPFPWGVPLKALPSSHEGRAYFHLAVIHHYVWLNEKTRHLGASTDDCMYKLAKHFANYDAVVIGDNHKGWRAGGGASGPSVFNCGTFLRRKSDEQDYRPAVGLVLSDGTIQTHYLDTSMDQFVDVRDDVETLALGLSAKIHLQQLIDDLSSLGEEGVNFVEAIHRGMNCTDSPDEYPEGMREIVRCCVRDLR
jgi:DNA repair exonuclease SbcCD nuclease subunit